MNSCSSKSIALMYFIMFLYRCLGINLSNCKYESGKGLHGLIYMIYCFEGCMLYKSLRCLCTVCVLTQSKVTSMKTIFLG